MLLTATADMRTRKEIVERLHSQRQYLCQCFDRPNIRYCANKATPKKLLAALQQRKNDAGIIYCLSRKR